MKRKNLLALFFIAGILLVIDLPKLMSNCPAYSPVGSCGAPVDITCQSPHPCTCSQAGCHPTSQAASDNTASLSIVDSAEYINGTASFAPLTSQFQYQAGSAYFISFAIHSSTPSGRYGFQMTGLNSDNTMAGAFFVTDASHTFLQADSGIQYIGHFNANTNFLNWNYVWEAPTTTKNVTFYYSYNLGDSAQLAQGIPGGNVYTGTLQIQSTVSGINDLSDKISALSIFPNPTSAAFNLSFTLAQAETVSVNVYGIDGRSEQVLLQNEQKNKGDFNQSFNISNLASGIYLVKLTVGGESITKKITKL